ncbi:MAG: hypothetical protein NT149_03685 [Candidatus Gottesmanbacteria bacterium]|nr:hypothetical protein [Candidatus Gottesmanbacteria bacterium]
MSYTTFASLGTSPKLALLARDPPAGGSQEPQVRVKGKEII